MFLGRGGEKGSGVRATILGFCALNGTFVCLGDGEISDIRISYFNDAKSDFMETVCSKYFKPKFQDELRATKKKG